MTEREGLVLVCNTEVGVFFFRAQYCVVVGTGAHLRNSPGCLTRDRAASGALLPLAPARHVRRNDGNGITLSNLLGSKALSSNSLMLQAEHEPQMGLLHSVVPCIHHKSPTVTFSGSQLGINE